MSTIAVINQKGGVGKTTMTTNLASSLADHGKDVLVIDFDPQANLTTSFGFQPEAIKWTIYNVLLKRPETHFDTEGAIQEVTLHTPVEQVSLVPANLELSSAEIEMSSVMGRETLLREILEPVKDDYDYIFIDCPPTLGLLSMNALAAADELLIPFQTEFLALKGIQQLLDIVTLVQKRKINPDLKIEGFVGCLYDARKKLHKEMVSDMQQQFPEKTYQTLIRNNVAVAESPRHGVPVSRHAPRSRGAQDYRSLTEEFLRRHT